jgi:hypothetical protein
VGRLQIDHGHRTLAVRFPAEGRVPQVVDFENLNFDAVHDNGTMWYQLAVRLDDNLDEVYALMCAILDRVQLSGECFADAAEGALDSLIGILAIRRALTRERQVGLFGELLVLLALADDVGPDAALASWRGPLREEHDFGLSDVDLEVKTTSGERREHWISTTTQLMPTGDRPLYMISIQLTLAALDTGWTLPTLISQARSTVEPHAARLNAVLTELGYRDRDSDLYHTHWMLRTAPAFFRIDADFPALTQGRLDGAVPSAERITDVRYRLDLTGMGCSPEPFAFGARDGRGHRDD